MALFSLDPGLAIWTWIIFGVLLFLLARYAFPSLLKNIRDREESIARSVDNAAEIERRLAGIGKEHDEVMTRARAEADELLRQVREEGEALRKRLREQAELEAHELLEQARHMINDERAEAVESLRRELAGFVVDTSERIIGRSFTTNDDREWARELTKSI